MLNKYGFIPSKYRQPDCYILMFNGWCAVYTCSVTGAEYHLQIQPNLLSSSKSVADSIAVLRQDKDCRRRISGYLKTIKAAVAVIEELLSVKDGGITT